MSHGGAFRKFYGLRTLRSNYIVGESTYPGVPCLYGAHSKGENIRCWRDSKTHACLECIDQIKTHQFGLSIDRLAESVQMQALNFWSKVDITTFDDCWQWTDKPHKNQLYHFWKRTSIRKRYQWHPIAIAVWLTWGDTGSLGTESICGNRRCVNPLHNLPKGLLPSIRLEDYDTDWLNSQLASLKADVSDYLLAKANLKPKKPRIFVPSVDSLGVAITDESAAISAYQKALNSTVEQIALGTHAMQSCSVLSDKIS